MLYLSKLKSFRDGNVLGREENLVGNGENASPGS